MPLSLPTPRSRLHLFVIGLTAMLVLLAVAASAQATEGPFWRTTGKRVAAGETRAITAVTVKPVILKSNIAKLKVECSSAKFAPGATISGSSGANAGKASATDEFTGCTGGAKEEQGTECEPVGGAITTPPTTITLGYSSASETGPILVLVSPTTGSTLATIKFTGTGCLVTSTTVSGSLAGEIEATGKVSEVGKELAEAGKLLFSFGETVKTVFVESGGALSSIKAATTAFGTAATLTSESTFELSSKEKWGVFT